MTRDELLEKTSCRIAEIDGEFYPYQRWGNSSIVDIGGRDRPANGGHWTARETESGIKYVASGSPSLKAALMRIRRAFNI